ncbi:DUF4166 domain-containing protein [Bacillus atrophaeus]|uniref:DUF4166 domain-containing protein n=1 Tax=Bacillus atrophaeus TaxID=1452 RepID=UPI00227DA753|nr:DUF4166 domain-containing protein [Bacillus atrophaeus]MCY8518588.1 DUF4166 domain-containing protein [Bacillus atrophaeus]MCY9112400.1 DUF4166 domain-containing protein [Bacillus atrophaeus]
MVSIYEHHIVNSHLLHPKLRKRYQLDLTHTFRAKGVMSEISGGSFIARGFLKFGVLFRCFFSERGKDVPFIIENKAFSTEQHEIAVQWNRTFFFSGKKRFFDAVMIHDEKEKRILDYFGKPHLLLSVLSFEAEQNGALKITSGKQWFLIFGKKIPIPKWLRGKSTVYESYHDENACFTIEVHVENDILGTLFYYKGSFQEAGTVE